MNFFLTDFPVEGLAWDSWSQGGPFLWAYYYDETENVIVANRLNPSSGGSTGVFFSMVDTNDENAMPEDVIVTPHKIDNKLVLGALNSSTYEEGSTDYVSFYDLATTPAPDWIKVIPPSFGETEPYGQSTFDIRLNAIMEDTLMVAQVRISSNDVVQPEVIIPVNFMMMPLNPTDVAPVESSSGLISKVYPNPANGRVNLKLGSGQKIESVMLYSINGSLVKERSVDGAQEATINLSGINPGIYILEVTGADKSEIKKVVVK